MQSWLACVGGRSSGLLTILLSIPGKQLRAPDGVDVDLVEIALHLGQLQEQWVHDAKPQRWDERYGEHAQVPARQLRQVVEVPERLIAPRRVRMMVGVPLEMEQQEIGKDAVAVPG